MPSKDQLKVEKKQAKAAAKAAKKAQDTFPVAAGVPTAPSAEGKSPAQRSAEAAERQLQFQRWRVVIAALSALIALVSLIVLLWRSAP